MLTLLPNGEYVDLGRVGRISTDECSCYLKLSGGTCSKVHCHQDDPKSAAAYYAAKVNEQRRPTPMAEYERFDGSGVTLSESERAAILALDPEWDQ